MLKLALIVPVVFALGTAGTTSSVGTVSVEGATPVSLGKKKGSAYPVTCTAPIKFTAAGPASLIVDVSGRTDAISCRSDAGRRESELPLGLRAREIEVKSSYLRRLTSRRRRKCIWA